MAYTPKKTKEYEDLILQTFLATKGHHKYPEGTPLRLDITVLKKGAKKLEGQFAPVKPDMDNVIKVVMDALEGFAYVNDNSICHIGETKKIYGLCEGLMITLCEARTDL